MLGKMLSILYFKNPNKIVNLIFEVIIFFPGKMAKNQSVFHQQKTFVSTISFQTFRFFYQQKTYATELINFSISRNPYSSISRNSAWIPNLWIFFQTFLIVFSTIRSLGSSTSRKHMRQNFSIKRNPYSSTSRNSLYFYQQKTYATELFDQQKPIFFCQQKLAA